MSTINDETSPHDDAEVEERFKSADGVTKDMVYEYATRLSGDEEIGALVVKAMEMVGRDGTIVVEEGVGTETTLEVVNGMEFEEGFQSPYFITDSERGEVVLLDAAVLTCAEEISRPETVDRLAQEGEGALLIISKLGNDALKALAKHAERGARVASVNPPGFGYNRAERLTDIAKLTGARLFAGEGEIQLSKLGRCRKVMIRKDRTILIGTGGEEGSIRARIDEIRQRMGATTSQYDQQKLGERLGRIAGGVAVIWVGGETVSELKEKAATLEDVVSRLQALIRESE